MANDTTTTDTPPKGPAPKQRRLVPVLLNRESMLQVATAREKDGSIQPKGLLFLASGYNLVDEDLWLAAKKNEIIVLLLKTKIPPATAVEESPEKVGHFILVEGKPVDADNPLASLAENEALRFVSETFQVPLLKKLLEQDSRATVLRAIRGQIEKIETPKKEAASQRAKA